MVTFESVRRVTYKTSSLISKNAQVQYVYHCCLFLIFDQTTMDQEKKCLTSLSFDLCVSFLTEELSVV